VGADVDGASGTDVSTRVSGGSIEFELSVLLDLDVGSAIVLSVCKLLLVEIEPGVEPAVYEADDDEATIEGEAAVEELEVPDVEARPGRTTVMSMPLTLACFAVSALIRTSCREELIHHRAQPLPKFDET
jgi:hypothetical protein